MDTEPSLVVNYGWLAVCPTLCLPAQSFLLPFPPHTYKKINHIHPNHKPCLADRLNSKRSIFTTSFRLRPLYPPSAAGGRIQQYGIRSNANDTSAGRPGLLTISPARHPRSPSGTTPNIISAASELSSSSAQITQEFDEYQGSSY